MGHAPAIIKQTCQHYVSGRKSVTSGLAPKRQFGVYIGCLMQSVGRSRFSHS